MPTLSHPQVSYTHIFYTLKEPSGNYLNINHISVTAAPEVISIINFVDKTAKIQTYPNYQEDFSTENVSYNLLESDHLFSTVENPALTSIWPKGYIEINYQNIPGSQPDNFSL